MHITHEQAHKLIQLNMDRVLSAPESAGLSAHLRDCIDCQSYADEMKEVERLLFPTLKKQWQHQPIPLSISALTEKRLKSQASILLTTRTAAIGLVVVTLFFSIWQFVFSSPAASQQIPIAVPPVPTPSSQTVLSTRVTSTSEDCETMLYRVRSDDTLAGIATQFSVSEEEIMAINSLSSQAVGPAMELVIPICNFTPTSTVHPATYTTTYTPILKPTTSTPGG
jgi:LysM repeat protein